MASQINPNDLRSKPIYANSGFTNQISEWWLGDEYMFQERAYFPYSWYEKPSFAYWFCTAYFKYKKDAAALVKRFNSKLVKIQHSFYGDGYFFIINDSFDEAVRFLNFIREEKPVFDDEEVT